MNKEISNKDFQLNIWFLCYLFAMYVFIQFISKIALPPLQMSSWSKLLNILTVLGYRQGLCQDFKDVCPKWQIQNFLLIPI